MRRNFRRRPRPWILALLCLAILVGMRLWSDRTQRLARPPELASLAERSYAVVRVVDGDTLILAEMSEPTSPAPGAVGVSAPQARVRLIGVDAPETGVGPQPAEPGGKEAEEFARRFVSGGSVTVQLGRRRQDRFGRFLAYLFVDDLMLNEELARAGLATAHIYPGEETPLSRRIVAAEREAQTARRGIWAGRDSPR